MQLIIAWKKHMLIINAYNQFFSLQGKFKATHGSRNDNVYFMPLILSIFHILSWLHWTHPLFTSSSVYFSAPISHPLLFLKFICLSFLFLCNRLMFVESLFLFFQFFCSGAKSLVSVLWWFELLCTHGIISHDSFW